MDASLDGLTRASVLTYRHFRRAFRPYEGSDVDVDARLREARAEREAAGAAIDGTANGAGGASDTAALAARLAGAALPVVARRHSFLTETLRA